MATVMAHATVDDVMLSFLMSSSYMKASLMHPGRRTFGATHQENAGTLGEVSGSNFVVAVPVFAVLVLVRLLLFRLRRDWWRDRVGNRVRDRWSRVRWVRWVLRALRHRQQYQKARPGEERAEGATMH